MKNDLSDIAFQLSKLRKVEEECLKRLPDKCYLPEAINIIEEVLKEHGVTIVDSMSLIKGLETRGKVRVERSRGLAFVIKT
ncbi:MAG: hypothetical protein DRN04_04695 [Thermoprotei archaeon]|nr:MAG: hypothetical protein DRN04_04695 [Thermoprotei archaeon]